MTDTADTRDVAGARVDPAPPEPEQQPAVVPAAGDYRLEHRYTNESGRVLMSSIQALARLPVEQLRRDRAAGLRTAAFLSGYPGSPLGGYDLEVARMLRLHGEGAPGAVDGGLPIVHRPAVNEELGASAVMGSQLAASRPDARYDGVVGIWYGKAPGLDRATDAIRHGVFAGTAQRSGVVALVGDDPAAKSSTMPSSSDAALVDLHMPILYPGTPAECLELGLHAVAISRACGLWSAMKVVTPVADAVGTVDLPALRSEPVMPDGWDAVQRHPSAVFLGSARMIAVEKEFRTVRADLAYRYGVLNGLNRIAVDPADAWIGIVSTGYTYYEVREALRRLGLHSDDDVRRAGVRLLQLRMPVPFDRDMVRRFADGLEEIVVVEEKNPTLEGIVKETLYDTAHRPRVVGKKDETGAELIHSYGLMDADAMVDALRARLSQRLADRLAPPPRERIEVGALLPLATQRTPFFCSGCPHNWGTKVPDGTLVGAGTGCHGMSLLMDPGLVGDTFGITAMGNEGAHWIGMSPFVDTEHVVQNFGDGTYFHSGQLAVQAAVGAGTRITFKILYNDTVAMTGGQDATFAVGVPQLATTLLQLGVKRVVVTSPDAHGYDRTGLPREVAVRDRDDIVAVQTELAAVHGVTVLIHHQPCAAELRRGRKRGKVETPPTRIAINPRICEGCGDCGQVSNCLSVQPLDTPLGRRTRIDQDSCNLDFSCVKGDCPAFMEVDVSAGSDGRDPGAGSAASSRRRAATGEPPSWDLPAPAATDDLDVVRVRLAGIGGTGVVTTAQVLGTAAMLDGWGVHGLDQTGLSQKAGPVISDVVLTRGEGVSTNLIGAGQTSVLLALDGLVGASDPVLAACDPSGTRVVLSTTRTPTGRMVSDPAIPYPAETDVEERLRAGSREVLAADASRLARALVGDAAYANVLVLGIALQAGALPVDLALVARAVELNGVAVERNLAALAWGRAWAADPARVESEARARRTETGELMTVPDLPTSLTQRVAAIGLTSDVEETVRMLAADLVGYQDARYAGRFLRTVERVAAAEHALDALQVPDAAAERLTETVARSLHKLMAYKDEYEVARLMLLPEGEAAAAEAGAGPRSFLLHPPVLKALGRQGKIRFDERTRPAFAALARGKRLRGTRLDPFGATHMRRTERELVGELERTVVALVRGLTPATHARAVHVAGLPDAVRGYEELKLRRVAEYRAAVREAMSGYLA
ncbi:indolepyruvate ferredoxin oxidoreductase family protein [Aquipuribacter sp. SD81]|uniref:indolepyruvate ferredoxin oxidoreductase family protein n=1 Tax=Aquipuribacter sp. SD81 TaxID=3127703 RepID=UPI003015EBA2